MENRLKNIFPITIAQYNPFHTQEVDREIINSSILIYFDKHKLIDDQHYGFRQQRFISDLQSFVIHLWHKSRDYHRETQIIALDTAKVFDKV